MCCSAGCAGCEAACDERGKFRLERSCLERIVSMLTKLVQLYDAERKVMEDSEGYDSSSSSSSFSSSSRVGNGEADDENDSHDR